MEADNRNHIIILFKDIKSDEITMLLFFNLCLLKTSNLKRKTNPIYVETLNKEYCAFPVK